MALDVFFALVVFAFVSSVTPGPNNLMLLASGVNFGFRRTVPHMAGIGFGFWLLLRAVGLGRGAMLSASTFQAFRCGRLSVARYAVSWPTRSD